jgi:acyl carrier protein
VSGPIDSSQAARRDWVVRYLASLLGIDAADVDLTKGLGEYGLDSVDAMIMAGQLEDHFQIEIDPAVFFEYDTLQQMLDAWNATDRKE